MGISPKKTARIQGKVISFCVFFRGSRVTPLKMGANIFFYPTLRDPDSPCQRMIGVYNHLSKVCRFHYQSQKGNWIPRAIWIPLISGWWQLKYVCYFHPEAWGRFPILTHIFQMGWNHHLIFFGNILVNKTLKIDMLHLKKITSLKSGNSSEPSTFTCWSSKS